MTTLTDAFEGLIQQMYDMENTLVDAMPKIAHAVQSEDLKETLLSHIEETREHANRLGDVAKICRFTTIGKDHGAIKEMIAETDQIIVENEPGAVRDALLILGVQSVEHCEMAYYRTAISWAKTLDMDDCLALLSGTLDEEKRADKKLGSIAVHVVNDAAKEAALVGDDEKRRYLS